MGSAYAAHMLGKENPVVSILSIGEEETKGNEISREAAFLLQKSSINFTGNIEAKAVYRGTADVIVCDGFVGNISLKVSESAAELITNALKDVFSHNLRSKLGYLLVRPYLDEFKKRVDYQEHGGVPLLGLNGTVIVCHGSSRKKSIKISIVEAERFIRMDVNSRIRRMLEKNNAKENDAGKKEGYWERAEETVRHKPNQPESPR
jgi:glycerol-3-phosphate acyltransferase PlsX